MIRTWLGRWSLLPQRSLLVALLAGAALIALASLLSLLWLVALVYHAILAVLVGIDLARLPGRRRFSASRTLPSPFSLGARQEVAVTVICPRAAGLEAAVADHAPLELRPAPREVGGTFDAGGELRVVYAAQAVRRGAYTFGPVDLRCWRRGGWLVRQVRIPLAEAVAVYPDVVAVRAYNLMLRRGLRSEPGARRGRPPGAGTAFAGLRDYVRGDDVRRISWKASARRDQPVTMEVEAERGQQVILAVDCGRLMSARAGLLTKLDRAVNAALLLAHVAASFGDRVGMLAFSDDVRAYLKPQRGAGQVTLINRALYDLAGEAVEPDYGTAFTHIALRLNRRSLVVVLTDILEADASRDLVAHALRLGRRHLVLVVAMADPAVLEARRAPVTNSARAYEWAAAEEVLGARSAAFEALQRGGVLGLDVEAGRLSPALVERYLELKDRALL